MSRETGIVEEWDAADGLGCIKSPPRPRLSVSEREVDPALVSRMSRGLRVTYVRDIVGREARDVRDATNATGYVYYSTMDRAHAFARWTDGDCAGTESRFEMTECSDGVCRILEGRNVRLTRRDVAPDGSILVRRVEGRILLDGEDPEA